MPTSCTHTPAAYPLHSGWRSVVILCICAGPIQSTHPFCPACPCARWASLLLCGHRSPHTAGLVCLDAGGIVPTQLLFFPFMRSALETERCSCPCRASSRGGVYPSACAMRVTSADLHTPLENIVAMGMTHTGARTRTHTHTHTHSTKAKPVHLDE